MLSLVQSLLPGTQSKTMDVASMSDGPLVQIRDLHKAYSTPAGDFPALKGVDIEIARGEFLTIIGKSGAGKSTLINMLTGIDRPNSGQIIVGGQEIQKMSEAEIARWRGRNLGVIFQFFQLIPTLTVLQNVVMPMDFASMYTRQERQERAMMLLERVEIAENAHKLPHAISGGQQQRVAIARALACDPPLIVADEPTGSLDSKTTDAIYELFHEAVSQGKSFMMVTHDDDLAARSDRVIEIKDGLVINEY